MSVSKPISNEYYDSTENNSQELQQYKPHDTTNSSHLRTLRQSLLGHETHLVRTLSSQDYLLTKKHFKSLMGAALRPVRCTVDGQPFRFQPSVFVKGLKKFLRTHRFLLLQHTRQYEYIDYRYYQQDPETSLRVFKPSYIGVIVFHGNKAKIKKVFEAENPVLPPMFIARDKQSNWVWITSRTPLQHCITCGRYWVRDHECSEKRSAFYYHVVQGSGMQFWQHLHFSCPAQAPNVRQLFVTYDIETYTVFENKGKRMQPFMLCFMLSGHQKLVQAAAKVAQQDKDILTLDEGYYWLNTTPGVVGRKFRTFRTALQRHFSRELVRRVYRHNTELFDTLMLEHDYSSIYDVSQEHFSPHKITLPENFYSVDIIILGHNICKFDELLLATELVERRDIFPAAGRVERSFMPRVGRLLFNDIFFHMPNPNFNSEDPTRVDRWTRGLVTTADLRSIFVRFMVRDTLQLTSGAKLSKAAAAYSLELSKGHCPYEAINDHVATGRFEADEDGFPVEKYWEDAKVITEQKMLWKELHPDQPYDIVRACLEYCMQDVRVTQKLAQTLYINYNKYFKEELGMDGSYNIFIRPTIPSNTHAFWKQLTFASYAKERIQQLTNSTKKKQAVPPNYVAEVYAPHRTMFKHIRQALRGGRCYPNILGPYCKPVYVFDICGMYASALTHPMPHGMPLDPKFTAKHVEELNAILGSEGNISYFDTRIKPSILKIEAYPPPAQMLDPLPPICSRRGGRLVWTNEALFDEVVTILDILTLHNRGWSVTVLQDEFNIVFPEWKTLCAEYVSKNIAAKEKADREKNEVMRSISKMLSNALYGAFATNMDTTRVVFEQDLSEEDLKDIYEGTQVVKHVTLLNDGSFSGTTVQPSSEFDSKVIRQSFNSPWSESDEEEDEVSDLCNERLSKEKESLTDPLSLTEIDLEVEEALRDGPFIEDSDHAHYARARETQFKPMRLLDATPEALTVLHLEKLDKMVENKRYATQIACFVLGWSRAFFSDWCEILHGPDRGTHMHDREPQSLYGDTDSLFVTESGYQRMKTRGAHRLKNPNTRLTYDPENPGLYWACDCDIKCKACGADTFASETIFLAPKLYGLKDAVCTNPLCGKVGAGKIRSKGHKQAELIYDTLMRCWNKYEDELYGGTSDIPELHTRRNIFKTTLLNKVSRYDPFTIHNEQLTRILRPWKDPTLYEHGGFLYPYDTAHPNPRSCSELRLVPDVGIDEPLAPLRYPLESLLTVEECDEILEALQHYEQQ
ncbi:DNA polymerase [Aviadenovirus bubonis]|nr:DNA polymerase [Owl adenovirus]